MTDIPESNSKKEYIVFGGVVCTTAAIIGISFLHLHMLGIALIVILACAEAVVLAYAFMHLKSKKQTLQILLLLTLVAFFSLLFWPAWDIAYSPRENSEYIFK
jgi:hypothetical protein